MPNNLVVLIEEGIPSSIIFKGKCNESSFSYVKKTGKYYTAIVRKPTMSTDFEALDILASTLIDRMSGLSYQSSLITNTDNTKSSLMIRYNIRTNFRTKFLYSVNSQLTF